MERGCGNDIAEPAVLFEKLPSNTCPWRCVASCFFIFFFFLECSSSFLIGGIVSNGLKRTCTKLCESYTCLSDREIMNAHDGLVSSRHFCKKTNYIVNNKYVMV